jgi:transcription-repair coupling factor (superfamily II helicase)
MCSRSAATPIPRTLQLALTGVRDLSIIASPPVDRLAVRTLVAPFDPIVVREALLRERYAEGRRSTCRRASTIWPK